MRNSSASVRSLRFNSLFILFAVTMCAPSLRSAKASDWLTMPSTFSHDPSTGMRVSQFAPVAAPSAPGVANFRSSGYTHTRSSLNYGQSADNYHRVEEWGDPVRPYGEWRFPNRPYSAPYQNWGPPFAGLNLGVVGPGFGYGPGYGNGGGNGYAPGYENGGGYSYGTGTGVDPSAGIGGVPGYQPGLPPGGYHGRPNLPGSPIGGANPFNPYPSGPGTPYPVAPYYDGYYPVYRD